MGKICLEKLKYVADKQRESADNCDKIISLLLEHPEIDDAMVAVFGVQPRPPVEGPNT